MEVCGRIFSIYILFFVFLYAIFSLTTKKSCIFAENCQDIKLYNYDIYRTNKTNKRTIPNTTVTIGCNIGNGSS
jgi:hypothetical protein